MYLYESFFPFHFNKRHRQKNTTLKETKKKRNSWVIRIRRDNSININNINFNFVVIVEKRK